MGRNGSHIIHGEMVIVSYRKKLGVVSYMKKWGLYSSGHVGNQMISRLFCVT